MEFAKAALLDGHRQVAPKPLRCCSWRSSVIPDHPGVRYQIALIQDKAGMDARVGARTSKACSRIVPRTPAC